MVECFITVSLVVLVVLVAYFHQKRLRRHSLGHTQPPTIGIFHPWCSDGGGGERVLWCMIEALISLPKSVKICIYVDGIDDKIKLLEKLRYQFNININPDDIELIPVRFCKYIKPSYYPIFTLLFQNLASIIVAINAAYNFEPDIYIDTTGFSFTYPIFKLFCFSKVIAYVHYPTITHDMIEVVKKRKSSYNNNDLIARIAILTKIKLIYYRIFSWMYYCCGRCTDIVMVNSSWTRHHIENLWYSSMKSLTGSNNLHTIYPPCGLNDTLIDDNNHQDTHRKPIIISLGQYRPEKDHISQLFIFRKILDNLKDESLANSLQLYIIGGCRNDSDYNLLENLTQMTIDLGIEKNVKFLTNISSHELSEILHTGLIGIHTMKNEHFGIGIVEMAASGLIVIAHKSGGPLFDIITTDSSIETGSIGKSTGFLADSINEYVLHLSTIFSMSQNDLIHIRKNAYSSMKSRFSDDVFKKNIIQLFTKFLI